MSDPSQWAMTMREKLCYMHGLLIGMRPHGVMDLIPLHECTEEQILNSCLKMLQPPERGS